MKNKRANQASTGLGHDAKVNNLQRVRAQVRKLGQDCEGPDASWQALAQVLNPFRRTIAEELGGLGQIRNTSRIQSY
jgi:hypothetical protein